ncbi:MAG TPA: transglycosylase SLT domain-containing protein [Caproiciproducens sp.]|nr:transglycosylase SLT domain-containing protein [Caproiciproducens sp.]
MKTLPKNHIRKEHIYAFVMIGVMTSASLFYASSNRAENTAAPRSTPFSSASPVCSVEAKPVIRYSSGEAQSTDSTPARESSETAASSRKERIKSAEMSYYDVPLSHDLQNYLFNQCEDRNVQPDLVIALMDVESHYNPKLISRTNDYGLMQINICHKDFLKKELKVSDLLDEKQNIKAGVYMLSGIVNKYSDMNQALMVYNCGESGARKLWKNGVYSTSYSRKVLAKLDEIKS